jgi:hypothetical protein
MCAQCMVSAMGAVAGATGTRSWLATRRFRWLTPRCLRAVTVLLLAGALLASALLASGSSAPTHAGQGSAPPRAAVR